MPKTTTEQTAVTWPPTWHIGGVATSTYPQRNLRTGKVVRLATVTVDASPHATEEATVTLNVEALGGSLQLTVPEALELGRLSLKAVATINAARPAVALSDMAGGMADTLGSRIR